MIFHIFKKDLRLLWPYAAMLAVMQFVYAAHLFLNPGRDEREYSGWAATQTQEILLAAIFLFGAFLIAAIVQQDPIPGVRQDWLVRPIARMHLLLSKILSVVLLVHVPMLAADLLYGLAIGYSTGHSLGFAVSRGIYVLMVVSIPFVAFFSLTKNMMEAVASGFVIAVGLIGFAFTTSAITGKYGRFLDVTQDTGFHWVPQFAGGIVILLGALTVLGIQYFRRKTLTARFVTGAVFILFWAVTFLMPWETAFAIGQEFSSKKGEGNAIALSFEPAGARFHRTPHTPSDEDLSLYLPVRVDGLPADSVLRADRYSTRAIFASGESVVMSVDLTEDFRRNGAGYLKVGGHPLYGSPLLVGDERVKNEPLQLEIEMWMTLLKVSSVTELPALDGPLSIGGVGCIHREWTMSRSWDDDEDTEVNLWCEPVLQPSCYTLELLEFSAPYVFRPAMKCPGDYKPIHAQLLPGGASITAVAYVRDPLGHVKYPKDFDNLFKTKAALKSYEPVDHFTKKIVIPEVRLKDWTADTTNPK